MKIGYEAKRVFHNKTGLGNYSRDLIRILANFYPDNEYYLYNPKSNKEKLFSVPNPMVVEKLPATPFYQKFYNIWRQKGIVNDLVNDQVTIFHGLSGEIPNGLRAKNIKSVVTIHDLIFMRYPKLYSFWDRKIHFHKFLKAAKNADLVIAISEQTKKDIITFLKIPESKIQVIYQGCQSVFKQQYTAEELEMLQKKFHLPSKFLLNVGTIEERKNAFSIVKAIKGTDIPLVLVGKETEYSKQIQSYCKENKLENQVYFLKGLSSTELAMMYQLATVFIYPSIFEGFGIPIIEALFSKTPVITTNSGVFPEAGGPSSIYVEPYAIEEMQSQILKLWNAEELRKEMAEKGFEFVQKFNDKVIAQQIMDAYKGLL